MSGWTRSLTGIAVALGLVSVPALAECARSDFEAVVDSAAGSLRDMNAANKPKFQDKLRQLREKRHWTQEQFMKEATPFVLDERIMDYDHQTALLLDRIASGGQIGAAAATPDCAMLESLKVNMKQLVDAQAAKWTYMTGRIDAELAK